LPGELPQIINVATAPFFVGTQAENISLLKAGFWSKDKELVAAVKQNLQVYSPRDATARVRSKASFHINQGTFGTIQGTFGIIQGTFGTIQRTFGTIQRTFGTIQRTKKW
jgi:hypothetical protein